ncbi:MAG: serine/threonine-protein kinase [Cyanobacteria bacterium J06633_8]
MSYCLNPHCQQPQNQKNANSCLNCGTQLLLKQRYRAIKPIGQGGFGRTFLAVDESKLLKPPCVIKQFLLQAQGADNTQKAAELFQQEALRLSNLGKHNQIPNFLEYLIQEEHQYLVQEYIHGYDLAQILKEQGTFKEAQIWELLNSLLPVLEFIHRHDVIHRDIKPQNIIRSQNGKLYLVDFGAAKVVTGTAILQTGTSIGTPEFVAPEQSRGKALYSSDLYSLGTTCIYLLTAVSPFDLFDIYENNWVWRQYLVDNTVSDKLGYVLDKLIENAISRRYQSVGEVLEDINNYNSISFSNNEPEIFTHQEEKSTVTTIKKNNYYSWQCVNTLTNKRDSINSIAVTPDGNILASGSYCWNVKLWEIKTGELLHTINCDYPMNAVAFSPDGLILASADSGKCIRIWNASSNKKNLIVKAHKGLFGEVNSLSFSPDSRIIASAGSDKTVKLWDVNTGEEIRTLIGHKKSVNSVAISPNGKFIISGSGDGTAILWDLNMGTLVNTLNTNAKVNSVAFSPNGNIIATGSDHYIIKLWQVSNGKKNYTIDSDNWINDGVYSAISVKCVTFSPNGEILATSSYNNDIKLWDVNTKQEICTLKGHSAKVNSLVFSPDGKTLFSGSDDKTIKMWRCQQIK